MKRARNQQINKSQANKKKVTKKTEDKSIKILKIMIISLVGVLLVAFTAFDAWQLKKELDEWNVRMTEQPEGEDNHLAPLDEDEKKINVLVLGLDKEGLRSDTIMILSYDTNKKTLNLLSVPRDTRMYVGSRYQKINSAYSTKNSKGEMSGAHGTIEAVTRLTGIPIHYYVEFTFDTFKETIDILGGVEFDVPQRMKYTDKYQDLYIDLQPGLQLLDGDKAEQFVRFRQYPLGDIQRIEAQQAFLNALIDQKLNSEIIDKIPEMFDMIKDNIKTNFSPMEVARYAMSLADLPRENINMYNLPGRFSEKSEYEASYWIAKLEKKNKDDETEVRGIKELVSEVFEYPNEAEGATTGPQNGATESDKKSQSSDKKTTPSKSESGNKKTETPKSTDNKKTETDKNDSSKKDTSKTDSKKTEEPSKSTDKTEDKKTEESSKSDKTDNKKTDDTNKSDKTDDKKTETTEDNKKSDTTEPIKIPDAPKETKKEDKTPQTETTSSESTED